MIITSSSLSYLWNFGSLLGLILGVQIISGLLLSSIYNVINFIYTIRAIDYGWFLQSIHANGASLFFILLFIHLGRGYYYSYKKWVWTSGRIIFIISMGTAFLGYVLPWGQISFWGATVITSLVSAIPYLGEDILSWLWGGYSITIVTLTRFYTLHYLLPLLIATLAIVHIILLHDTGSTNPLGLNNQIDIIQFHPSYTFKDLLGVLIIISIFIWLVIYKPYLLIDPENFLPANSMVTPIHIQPEWYFLFAYAILRSIPNKLIGVLSLVRALVILFILPKPIQFIPLNKLGFWILVNVFFILTWIGSEPVEWPYESFGQGLSISYFILIIRLLIYRM